MSFPRTKFFVASLLSLALVAVATDRALAIPLTFVDGGGDDQQFFATITSSGGAAVTGQINFTLRASLNFPYGSITPTGNINVNPQFSAISLGTINVSRNPTGNGTLTLTPVQPSLQNATVSSVSANLLNGVPIPIQSNTISFTGDGNFNTGILGIGGDLNAVVSADLTGSVPTLTYQQSGSNMFNSPGSLTGVPPTDYSTNYIIDAGGSAGNIGGSISGSIDGNANLQINIAGLFNFNTNAALPGLASINEVINEAIPSLAGTGSITDLEPGSFGSDRDIRTSINPAVPSFIPLTFNFASTSVTTISSSATNLSGGGQTFSAWFAGTLTFTLGVDITVAGLSIQLQDSTNNALAVPQLTTTPPNGGTLAFGNVLVGTSQNGLVTVQNTGTSGSMLTGQFPNAIGDFGPNSVLAFGPLADNASTNRVYTYTPSARGADSSNRTITSNVGNSVITFQGNGVAPLAAAAGAAVSSPGAFTLVGTIGTATTSVTNNGDGNLSGLGAVSNLNGTLDSGAGDFSLVGPAAVSIPDHTTINPVYNYAPLTRGADSENLTHSFTNGNPNGTNTAINLGITVSGQGVAPLSAASGGAVSSPGAFTLVGTTGQVTTSVSNNGDGNLSGLGAVSNLNGTLSGGAGEFALVGSPIVSLADHTGINPVYDYTPLTRGADSENLVHMFSNGNPDGTNTAHNQVINVTGQGVAPLGAASGGAVSIPGPFTLVGTTGQVITTVSNNGDGNLSGLGAVSNLNGTLDPGVGEFSLVGPGAISLPDHTSINPVYDYNPTSRGVDVEILALSLTNGNPDGTNTPTVLPMVVSGQGVAPLSNPADQSANNAGFILVGTSGTASISMTNSGDGNLSGLGAISNLNGTIDTPLGEFVLTSSIEPLGTVSIPDHTTHQYDYTYTPTSRGVDVEPGNFNFTNGSPDGMNNANVEGFNVQGQGVAPVQDVTHVDSPLTRITYLTPGPGSTDPPSITVFNNGDGNLSGMGAVSNLNGSIDGGTDARFTGGSSPISLMDHTNQHFAINYMPTTHTIDSSTFTISFTNGSADNTNSAEVVQVVVDGQGVGPIFMAQPYDTDNNPSLPLDCLDFGSVVIGSHQDLQLDISNITTDPDGGNPALTDLTLLSYSITGPDAGEFTLVGFVPGTVLSAGDLISYIVGFDPMFPPGNKTATLTFFTDQDAVLGGNGLSFDIQLKGLAAPEPASLLAFGLVTIGGLVGFRRARRRS